MEKKGNPDWIERYGYRWPKKQTNDLSIELACYRDPKKYATSLKREVHFRNAFNLMWPKFQWNDWMELMCWAWCNYRIIGIMGHTRASKTFGTSHFAALDYIAAPQITATTMTTTKFDALKTRMWGDFLRAIESCAQKEFIQQIFKTTSTSNELTFKQRDKPHEDKFLIQGVATDSGDKTAGKVRGQHSDRRRILVDEAQDVSPAIFMAFLNAMSAQDFIGALLTNPVEKISEFGEWVKPANGWESIHDTDLFWETSKAGGVCLHLDGLQSPNIKAGKTIFPFLLTQQYVEDIRKNNGEDSLEWWMYVRGFFPPDGIVARIWPAGTIEKARAPCEFDFQPEVWATLDAAFDHDDCALNLFDGGRKRDGTPSARGKKSFKIQTKVGANALPKDYQIARECIRICKEYGVRPENFIMDETGNARGVLAIMRVEWSPKVQGIYYGGEATERPLRLNDPKPAKELVKYFVTELWFRASYLAHEGMICGLDALEKKTIEDLSSRRYIVKQFGNFKLMIAESKDEMKKRLTRSPDWGDSLCQIGELMVRKGMLSEVLTGPKNAYSQMKKRAMKASSRYSEEHEYSHGAA